MEPHSSIENDHHHHNHNEADDVDHHHLDIHHDGCHNIIIITKVIIVMIRILAATSPASVTIDGVVKLRMEEEGMGARPPISCYSTIRYKSSLPS